MAHVPPGPLRATACVLLLAGFAVKVGLIPFQVWMPRGYAAAPGPARAIMAGVAVNVGFYGLWRTLALLGPPPATVTAILLVLASLTAVLGIAHAAVQSSLQRVIAYSSVENAGLILAGFGVALVGAAAGSRKLMAVGLLAATLQVIAHTAAKSLLFVSSAAIEASGRTDDLDDLRGSVRLAPWGGTGLAVGSLTLAGLPPTAGFVSEWFLLEALMQQFRVPGLGDRLVLAVTGAAVALTAGFAGVTFVRLIGLVVLGRPCTGTAWRAGRFRRDRTGRRRAAGCGLPGARRADAAGDQADRGGPGAGAADRNGERGAEVTLDPAACLRRLLDTVAVMAVAGHAGAVRRSRHVRLAGLGHAAAAGAPRPAVAVCDCRRVRTRQLHCIRLR